MAEVLRVNFSEVPEANRWKYAELSEGFIGLAADMCKCHPSIQAAGDLGPVMQSVEEYYRLRLPEEQRKNIEAIALVSRVGLKGDQEAELDDLCQLCSLSKSEVKDVALQVHSVPGFVGIGGPYLYVRPQIIARVAFGEAWARWASHDQDGFLKKIPASLLDQFRERVNKSAVEEVRGVTAGFFRGWVGGLGPGDLKDGPTVERLCTLVETQPEEFLPQLRSIVESAPAEELKEIKGEWWGGAWGPRRSLVWLCERLAAFPEYFENVEQILLRLAIAESEPDISNNATHIWIQLFRIALSGTAVPFDARLATLRSRVYSENKSISSLALDALDTTLDPFASRTGGPLVVAGRIPPPDWAPKTLGDARTALSLAVLLVVELVKCNRGDIQHKAVEISLNNLYNLLGRGFLDELTAIFDPSVISSEVKARAVNALEHALFLHSEYSPADRKWPSDYLERIKGWSKSLTPADPTERLLIVLSATDWQFDGERREQWMTEVRDIATLLFNDAGSFKKQFDVLFSEVAKGAGYLGEEIGRLDVDGTLLQPIIEGVLKYHNSTLGRGYISGYTSHEGSDLERVNELLDMVQSHDAQLAYELFIVGGRATRATERTLRLVEAGKLSVRHFRALALGWRGTPLAKEEISAVVGLLLAKISKGDVEAAEVAVDLVAENCLERKAAAGGLKVGFVDLAWSVVEATALNPGRESFWWGKILDSLVPHDLPRAAKVAASALLGEGLMQDEEAGKVLQEIAKNDPGAAVEALGSSMMDEKRGWRFLVGRFDFVAQLPVAAIVAWVDRHGVEAARVLAGQLPPPSLRADGELVVPPLTEYILTKFEDDDQVFRRFATGVHNLQSYVGDIVAQHLHEAEIAKKFLSHPLRRVREWAKIELMEAEAQAKYWREWEEEQKSRY